MENMEVIFSYTRAQAIEDGVLVDVSETGREAGFAIPVALTATAYEDCVTWTEEDGRRHQCYQDEDGRLWDVLFMASYGARANEDKNEFLYDLYRVPREGRGHTAKKTTLKAHCGPGDDGQLVITIMLPYED